MKMQPKLSVIIPVYNVEKYLGRCLDSIVNQTLKDIEIICVNDGSTDNSLTILEEYAQKDKRIKIVSQSNQGISVARNTGIKLARSPYITFIDSDDAIDTNAYKDAISHMNSDIDCVFWGTEVIGQTDENQKKIDDAYYSLKYEGEQTLTQDMIYITDCSAWNKIYKKDIIDKYKLKFPVGRWYEDACFYFQYMPLVKKAYFINKPYHRYYRHENSTMSKTFNKTPKAMDHLYICEPIYNFYKTNDLLNSYKDLFMKVFELSYRFAQKYIPVDMYKDLDKQTKIYIKQWHLKKLNPHNKLIKSLTNGHRKIIENLFSIKNTSNKKHKLLTICGLRIKFKRKKKQK